MNLGDSKLFNSTPRWKYQVFVSYRGEDTRKGFADHLCASLQRKGIITFKDDKELERGEVISQELSKAIQESLSTIVILSKNYASSTWCLDELQISLESRKTLGREVFPVFYGVDPSDVRHQRRSFEDAFRNHDERFREDKEKVGRWRSALREVANLSGWACKDLHEAKLIEEIVEAVWTKLRPKLASHLDGLVGMDSRMQEFDPLLRMGSEDVRFIGIWGMGGIGKTTLARVVFETIKNTFEISCFLANVREVSEINGLVHLQRILLSRLKLRGMEIDDEYEGKMNIRNFFCNRSVLLVLDDINHISQLENLAGNKEWFGQGSIVIVTTRDVHLLDSHETFEKFEVKLLNDVESLDLFYSHAFKRHQPNEGYSNLSQTVVHYAGGVPLALKVLGSFLCGRNASEWEDALNKIKKAPHSDIWKTLRISYDGLDHMEKNIFLDVACFFKGMEKDEVIHILEIFGLCPTIGIKVLLEKSLLTQSLYADCKWRLEMHDLLQDMARNIVMQECPNDVPRRSRLWSLEDVDHVLRNNIGTEVIQGVAMKSSEPYEVYWDPEVFLKMHNVRLLVLSNLHLPFGLKCLPRGLKVLEWMGCPLETLPLGVQLNELVDLKMHQSKIRHLWNGAQILGKLKFIDLSHSKDLSQTPDASGLPNLQRLILEGCINLVEVHPSLGLHKKLVTVNLKDCKNLQTFPSKIEMNSLKYLCLSGCSKLKHIPKFEGNMEHLIELNLEETAIVKLPPSIGNLNSLNVLNLRNCKNLVCLPHTICNLKSLRVLKIFGCSKFSELPKNLNKNEDLEELDVSGTAIKEIPSSLNQLKSLEVLSFSGCKGLQSSQHLNLFERMPTPTLGLSFLRKLDFSYCNLCDGSIPDDFGCLSSLETLDLRGNNFINLPTGCISNLRRLDNLYLSSCPMLQSFPMLPPYVSIVRAGDCSSIEPLSNSKQLMDLFAPLELQQRSPQANGCSLLANGNVFLNIPGNVVPSWFEKQNCIIEDQMLSCYYSADSIASVKVDIPQLRHSSEWTGIAICLAIENLVPSSVWRYSIHWYSKELETEESSMVVGLHIDAEYDCPHLCIFFLRFCDDYNCRHHVRSKGDQVQLIFYTQKIRKSKRAVTWEEELSIKRVQIRKCGWRVLCKQDFEVWNKTMISEYNVLMNRCNKRPRYEIEGDNDAL